MTVPGRAASAADGIALATLPVVTIVIPCRNEAAFIGKCLTSIVASDYPATHLDVIVVDGMSGDGTRAVVESFAERHASIRLVDNPQGSTPVAFNLGIDHARGDLIMLMSAHATLAPDAIGQCVEYSARYGADNVGGRWNIVARDEGLMASAIVAAMSHPFGVGNASYRTAEAGEPTWVDTAAYGCYRRSVFGRIGRFNERLLRGQDMELNRRLLRAGGKTLLVPSIVITYFARTDVRSFWTHNVRNGVWALVPFLYSEVMPVSWRHLLPLAFVGSLVGSAVLGICSPAFGVLGASIAGAYAVACAAASLHVAWRRRDVRYVVLMPIAFGMLHFGYGLGSLWGAIKVLAAPEFRTKVFGRARMVAAR